MVELSYYDNWYQRAPKLHEGVGALLFILLVIRMLWRWGNIHPPPKNTCPMGKNSRTSRAYPAQHDPTGHHH